MIRAGEAAGVNLNYAVTFATRIEQNQLSSAAESLLRWREENGGIGESALDDIGDGRS